MLSIFGFLLTLGYFKSRSKKNSIIKKVKNDGGYEVTILDFSNVFYIKDGCYYFAKINKNNLIGHAVKSFQFYDKYKDLIHCKVICFNGSIFDFTLNALSSSKVEMLQANINNINNAHRSLR